MHKWKTAGNSSWFGIESRRIPLRCTKKHRFFKIKWCPYERASSHLSCLRPLGESTGIGIDKYQWTIDNGNVMLFYHRRIERKRTLTLLVNDAVWRDSSSSNYIFCITSYRNIDKKNSRSELLRYKFLILACGLHLSSTSTLKL